MERLRLPDPLLAVDGERLACETHLAYGGAYQLTIWSIVPNLTVELHSTYLGHPDGQTAVAHLQLRPDAPPRTVTALQPGHELPVRDARRLCLYDHLAVLSELVTDATGLPVRLELADRALELVDLA